MGRGGEGEGRGMGRGSGHQYTCTPALLTVCCVYTTAQFQFSYNRTLPTSVYPTEVVVEYHKVSALTQPQAAEPASSQHNRQQAESCLAQDKHHCLQRPISHTILSSPTTKPCPTTSSRGSKSEVRHGSLAHTYPPRAAPIGLFAVM